MHFKDYLEGGKQSERKDNFFIFLWTRSRHIQYVMDCLKETTSKVRNIKKYLLAALFNAPTTIKSYYQQEVNHDFPQYACAR